MRRLNSALFVDFDNLFISLQNRGPDAARAFGEAPRLWLEWLEDEVETPGFPENEMRMRSFLIRRAYASPRAIQVFRPYFSRSAFQVIECPPLTSQGKNTADIQMVMDILDTITMYPHIEEVVIFSSDSDFTPVLTRLRAHAKRSVVYVNEVTAAAYKAGADELVLEDEFAEMLIDYAASNPATSQGQSGNGRRFPPKAGMGKASQARAQAAAPFPMDADQPALPDFASHRVMPPAAQAPPQRQPPGANELLATEMAISIREFVVGQTAPVPLREIVEKLKERLGPRVEATRFAGAGTISSFLRRTVIDGVGVSLKAPAVLYDPALVSPDAVAPEPQPLMDGVDPALAELARRIGSVTNVPELSPQVYAAVFETLSENLNAHPFSVFHTTKGVRDRLMARGIDLHHRLVSFILRGLEYARHPFAAGDRADTLARKFRDQVLFLTKGASLELSEDEIAFVGRWITGEVSDQAPDDAGAHSHAAQPEPQPPEDLDTALEAYEKGS
jgi:hypothetical protein